jgi:imidazolonepropionase
MPGTIVPTLLVRDIDQLLTLNPPCGLGALGVMTDGAVLFQGDSVAWVGPSNAAPAADQIVSGRGCIGLPGLVDCHTHSLFAGSRADEFRRRLEGASYTEILESGGGILSTVRATCAASDEQLSTTLAARLRGFLHNGVTTVEVKTGYALAREQELRCLRLLRRGEWPVSLRITWLGAHTIPSAHRTDRAGWLAQLMATIPEAADLADMVDVYCDAGAFTLQETRQILSAGIAAGMVGRVHAEQVTYTGAAALAAELGCASADHLEQIDAAGIAAMASRGTVAVLLPGAMTYLNDPPPPVAALREAGVPLAVATDFNPGSSPVRDLWACATLACLKLGLTPEEAIAGITVRAAQAMGLSNTGWLGPGSVGDMALIPPPPGEPSDWPALVQYLGGHRASHVIRGGRVVVG